MLPQTAANLDPTLEDSQGGGGVQQSAGTLLLSHDPNGGKKRTPATQTGRRIAKSTVDINIQWAISIL